MAGVGARFTKPFSVGCKEEHGADVSRLGGSNPGPALYESAATATELSRPGQGDSLSQDEFWSRVDRSGGPTACWPWMGPRTKDGYGRFRGRYAHRIALEAALGRRL